MIEYLSENMWQLWAVLTILGLILELTSGDFFLICIAIGSFGAALVAPFFGAYVQLVVFAVVTLFSLFQIRPAMRRYLFHKGEYRVSNANALIGRKGRVATAIKEKGTGYVAIDGDMWKAVSKDGEEIAEGERVMIVERESTIVTVVRVD